MKLLEEFILNNLTNYPEWAEYNDVLLNFVSSHKQKRPDMCIEGCKSLVEGVSKLIYINLSGDQNSSNWNHFSFRDKFEKCIKELRLDGYEDEFIRNNIGIVSKLGQIRNERGDVSHGQSYPKNSYSDADFARFISSWTEGLCYFLLSKYTSLKQQVEEDASYSSEQFDEFDDYLDSLHPDIEYISFSKALKEQDSPQYELLMDEYYNNQ